ncbi:hypothetical protein D3C72_1828880 [compost metagenome]
MTLLGRFWAFINGWVEVNVMVGQRGNVALAGLLAGITVQGIGGEVQVRLAVVLLNERGQVVDPVRVHSDGCDRSVRHDGHGLEVPCRHPAVAVPLREFDSLLAILFGGRIGCTCTFSLPRRWRGGGLPFAGHSAPSNQLNAACRYGLLDVRINGVGSHLGGARQQCAHIFDAPG